jgi:hypothetical protein
MENKIGTIRTFETPNFRVVVDAIEDFDVDLSWDEDGSTRAGLESGNLIAFCARARVFLKSSPWQELAADYLGGCIYKSLAEFADHRECGIANRKRIEREGRFQIYRKARPHEHCLSASDKLKKRGFATRERAEVWARQNATEPYEIFEAGKCGSYFAGMISESIKEARKNFAGMKQSLAAVRLRTETETQKQEGN